MQYKVTFEDGSESYLAHHGVLGMKWGVRNADTLRKYEGSKTITKHRQKQQKKIAKYDSKLKYLNPKSKRAESIRNRRDVLKEINKPGSTNVRKDILYNNLRGKKFASTLSAVYAGRSIVEGVVTGAGAITLSPALIATGQAYLIPLLVASAGLDAGVGTVFAKDSFKYASDASQLQKAIDKRH